MEYISVGLLAHVDAGKTTLSEAFLYENGAIRNMGRVDNQDTLLDNFSMERERGITIFSKQARMNCDEKQIILIDTPGHVDFSAEMERALSVLDYAILVISGADGVQSHTVTLWRLLQNYEIPTFLFINKMDQIGTDAKHLLNELQMRLSTGCVDFTKAVLSEDLDSFYDQIAMCSESLMEEYLETEAVCDTSITDAIAKREVFPCFFGSALKLTGTKSFMDGVIRYTKPRSYGSEFGAKVYKIGRDKQGNRMTSMKITGGSLKVKSMIDVNGELEKINQIRIYQGEKFELVDEVYAGDVCVVTGPLKTKALDCLGAEKRRTQASLVPVLSYSVIVPRDMDALKLLPMMKELEEEEPELNVLYEEATKEIKVLLMGEIQLEVLKRTMLERFNVAISFDAGAIVYKETIGSVVEGIGHFEPLRHYSEVHLILEPLESGAGMQYALDCSEDLLDKNWQRLIYTHLEERVHKGVLTGSELTDVLITVVAGKAHAKHTEGGDFRQSTYRAVRQGLMKAKNVLLEPYYEFTLMVPMDAIGRALSDMERLKAKSEAPVTEGEQSVIRGIAPVALMRDYIKEVYAYTHGHGSLALKFAGYYPCHNSEEVIETIGYDPERDLENPSSSVFCAHGSGFIVPWDQVEDYMHLEAVLRDEDDDENLSEYDEEVMHRVKAKASNAGAIDAYALGVEEIDAILAKTMYSNQKGGAKKPGWANRRKTSLSDHVYHGASEKAARPRKNLSNERYLLVDGYNVIFAWDSLNALANDNIDSARGKLLDILCDYQAMTGEEVICVFDAYRVKGHDTEILDYNNIHVVYTKEAETADQFIEKFAQKHGMQYRIRVVTSDGLEQIIIRGQGCGLISSREFEGEVKRVKDEFMERYHNKRD